MRGILLGLLLSNLLYLGWNILITRQESGSADIEPELIAGPGIVLLTEAAPESIRHYPAQGAEILAAPPSAQVDTPVENASDAGAYCAEIGPFESLADAEGFVGTNSSRFAMTVDVRKIPAPPDYRVYLPPLVSRELAASTMVALREAFRSNNLEIDSFLITSGELENGIALGLFMEQANAVNVLAELERLGYRAVISELEKFREEVWVLVSGVESRAIFDRHWAEIQLSRSYIQAGEKLCETIAHG